MRTIVFNPYSNRSKGLKLLKRELRERGYRVIELKTRGSRYSYNPYHLVINWGIPKGPNYPNSINYNNYNSTNKLRTLQLLSHINPLPFTQNKQEAIENYLPLVYCRTLLTSKGGNGIIVAQREEEVVEAPLYTKGIQGNTIEYRVHIFKDNIVDFTQKKKMNSERLIEEGIQLNPYIRNHSNGYIFTREGVTLPQGVRDLSLSTLPLLNMDFGAIDILYSQDDDVAYVLEVNSAPGITGTTVERYADAIQTQF